MRRIRFTENRFWLALLIAAVAFSLIVTYVQASTFIRAADNSVSAGTGGGNGSYNRAVACGDGFCYVLGGGTNNTSTGPSNVLARYNISTDTWGNISTSPTRPLFRNLTASVSEGYFVARARGVGSSPTTETLYSYNIATDTWQSTTTSPPSWVGGSGMVGVAVGTQYYLFSPGGAAGRIDITNLAGGWTSRQGPVGFPTGGVCVSGDSLQFDSPVYDPDNNTILIFHGDCVGQYSISNNSWTFSAADVLPESNTPVSLAFYDADNGVTFGYWDQPNSRMEMYTLNVDTYAVTAIANLVNADMDYGPFDDATIGPYPIPQGSYINSDGETELLFGSAMTNQSTPTGGTANRWFLYTGDPGGVTTTERDFDSWLDNFLSSLGMNSPVGRLLVGSLFAGVLFFVLAIRGVPWIMSLGITGFAVVTMTAAMVFDPAILLGLIAIVGVASIGLIFSLFIGGGDRGG